MIDKLKKRGRLLDRATDILTGSLVIVAIMLIFSTASNKNSVDNLKYDTQRLKMDVLKFQREIDSLQKRILFLESVDYFKVNLEKEWSLAKIALAIVESNLDKTAINPTSGASGIYQIMPIFLKEVNRLQKAVIYTPECVFDIKKSSEMVEIINFHRNPEKSIERLAYLHNPTERQGWYLNRVKNTYETLKLICYND